MIAFTAKTRTHVYLVSNDILVMPIKSAWFFLWKVIDLIKIFLRFYKNKRLSICQAFKTFLSSSLYLWH